MAGRLENRTAIVTGAAKGIGRAISLRLTEEGAVVVAADIDENGLQDTVYQIEEAGGQAMPLRADVSQLSDMETMAERTIDAFGRLDVLCSNAGIFPAARLEEMTEEDWDRVNNVNLKGTFFAVKACLPHMRDRGYGRVVLTSSITGPITGFPGWTHYGATKAGILGFMRTAALEMAEFGITINAVLPGNVMTEGLEDVGEDYLQRMRASIPLGELAEPLDIANVVLFLASDEAKYITGQTLIVDGGQVLPESILALE
ncbi:MAG: 3-oxoacyl-ACP reductase FabG [Anaerolineales bacterium]